MQLGISTFYLHQPVALILEIINGKDAVREIVRTIYGRALANASLSDFQAYDGGRKFTLSKLDSVAVNWCSENTEFTSLDGLQSLKAAITGDPLDMERKGRDERPMALNTVFLFNINKAPLLKGGLEAIKSRWAVLDFSKTFKVNADVNKGEIEADPRFRYDPEFIKTKVAPAFLNKMLIELQNLCRDGINYETTDRFVRDIKSESNHLWRFCFETGLDYYESGRAYISDIWDKLETWYRENGTL
ncbi:MAG: hypothetical protein F6K35_52050 [Okeania sp. SIO2H7]|nr:hypothetical protein [Okeania sp. SIO2H7]